MFSELLRQFSSAGFSGRITGEIVVHSGDVGVGNKLFPRCSCLGVSAQGVAYQCPICERDFGNYFWLQSGDGAGKFPIIEIRSRSSELVGALVVFDSEHISNPTLQEQIIKDRLPDYEDFDLQKLKRFGDLKTLDFGLIQNSGQIYISDVRELNRETTDIYSLSNIKSLTLGMYAFCEPMGRSEDKRQDNPMKVTDPLAPRPRILALFSSPASDQLKILGQYAIDDWPKQIHTWRTSFIDTVELPSETNENEGAEIASAPTPEIIDPFACKECGADFSDPNAKFCGMCGTRR